MSYFKYSRKSFSHNDQRNFKQIRAVGWSRAPETDVGLFAAVLVNELASLHAIADMMSVCPKSAPMNSSDSPVVFASAWAKQSPKFVTHQTQYGATITSVSAKSSPLNSNAADWSFAKA